MNGLYVPPARFIMHSTSKTGVTTHESLERTLLPSIFFLSGADKTIAQTITTMLSGVMSGSKRMLSAPAPAAAGCAENISFTQKKPCDSFTGKHRTDRTDNINF